MENIAPNKAEELAMKHATVEDAADEENVNGTTTADAESSRPPTMSNTAAGKHPAARGKAPIDTRSRELFPELGGPKTKGTNGAAPIWGAKATNGAAPTNGANHSPEAVPAATDAGAVPKRVMIPGRNVETITLEPQYLKSRSQLKRPIPDIIKDLNRKSRVNITMSNLSGGRLRFDATGPQDQAQQQLKDLVNAVGLLVRQASTTEHESLQSNACIDRN